MSRRSCFRYPSTFGPVAGSGRFNAIDGEGFILDFLLKRLQRRRLPAYHRLRPGARLRSALVRTGLCLAAISGAHAVAMVALEGMAGTDALWLTLTTVTTVGYGDLSASTLAGRAATVVLLYAGGIFVAAKLAGDYFDYRSAQKEAMKKGNWNWSDLGGHIVIIGPEQVSLDHMCRLVSELDSERTTAGRQKVLITPAYEQGLPPQLENLGIRFVHGTGGSPDLLGNAGVDSADFVIVLSWEEDDSDSDGRTFDTVHRIRECTERAVVLAECVSDDNRTRLRRAGANVVMRPVRAYPEMIVGAMVDAGLVEVLENLFTAAEEHLMALDAEASGTWADIVAEHVAADRGIPIAYRERGTGRVVTAPKASTRVEADALYLVSREGKQRMRNSRTSA